MASAFCSSLSEWFSQKIAFKGYQTHLVENPSAALAEYLEAFGTEYADDAFLTYYKINEDKSMSARTYSRSEFWQLACKAASVLQTMGLGHLDFQAHFFSCNTLGDVIFRLASIMFGTVPVTINWQADTPDRVVHKVRTTASKVVLIDDDTPKDVLELLGKEVPEAKVFNVALIDTYKPLHPSAFCREAALGPAATRIVIFTSGTTGNPKGVELSYSSYTCNRATFETFLQAGEGKQLVTVVVNPLHHTNSTSLTDWALRKPGARLHLIERYSTQYWSLLARAGTGVSISASPAEDELMSAIKTRNASGAVVVAPLVSRHFDFLDSLVTAGGLPLSPETLKQALTGTIMLLGSAPVGPTTVERLQRHAGRLPVVRFGSTETCLQVMGTPLHLNEAARLSAFEAGWKHSYAGQEQTGYYIGRPHPPYTECRVVKSVERGNSGYMEDCLEGQSGQLITRGDNIMKGYVRNPEATSKAIHDGGWYVNLGDVVFFLTNPADGGRDFYWQSRDSALLIRGGANYSYEQVNTELASFICSHYDIPADSVAVSVVGLRLTSEHEDECCVTIELSSPESQAKEDEIESSFLKAAKKSVSKGAKPDRVRFAELPRNFKGVVKLPDLKAAWELMLTSGG
mmetsp:Transcript_41802/g.69580  ORF Transcript_41802/g.69580 Transcript_41802/m.69580 type:complete len:629 (-) Transcript_41802:99-1985(-)